MSGFIFMIIMILVLVRVGNKSQGLFISNATVIDKLNKALDNNQFTNKKMVMANSYYKIIRADTHGENYIFAIANDAIRFNITDINSIYQIAQKMHVHNIVIVNQFKTPYPDSIIKKIREYEIEVWDLDKLNSLSGISKTGINTSVKNIENDFDEDEMVTKSVLRTSNTSDDKCKIDNNDDDPIQDLSESKTSIFKRIFRKTERL